MKFHVVLAVLACAVLLPMTAGADKTNPLEYEDQNVYMRIVVRTPDQLAAFYQGREFKRDAIDRILQTCFLTPIIKNKTYEALWLELDNWEFSVDGKPVSRIKRDYWKTQWQEVDLPQAHQSTFGWTLMPEARDLRLDEGVGGSVVIPMQTSPVTVKAKFATGLNREGPVKTITFEDVRCVPEAK